MVARNCLAHEEEASAGMRRITVDYKRGMLEPGIWRIAAGGRTNGDDGTRTGFGKRQRVGVVECFAKGETANLVVSSRFHA
jgi:hypothetical protein